MHVVGSRQSYVADKIDKVPMQVRFAASRSEARLLYTMIPLDCPMHQHLVCQHVNHDVHKPRGPSLTLQ